MLHKLGFDEPHPGLVVFDKVVVNGDGASDVFVFLQRTVQRNLPDCGGCLTQWNYQKWLVAPDGSAFATYASAASPLDAEDDIERLLSGA